MGCPQAFSRPEKTQNAASTCRTGCLKRAFLKNLRMCASGINSAHPIFLSDYNGPMQELA
jgi:hypothetical protein